MKLRYRKLRFRLHQVMEMAQEGDRASAIFDWAIMALIGLSVVEVILETVSDIAVAWGPWLWGLELCCSMIFTFEYIARLWACVEDRRYRNGWRGRLSYALSPMALIDLLAILPFFLPLVVALDGRSAGALRMLRLLRIFKLARYMESVRLITDVFRAKRRELLTVLVAEMLLLVAVASVVYVVEHQAQPEAFSSIPAAMWWAAVTLTTVGYGDMTPVTAL
ncbi:MAG: ion transporter, partial [Phycisphaerae bacterium]|nr:ion transporter [Phycisphaerae bacterium]